MPKMPESTVKAALLRRQDVSEMTGLSRATIYNYMASGTFPKPIRINGNKRCVRWPIADVEAWVASQLEEAA